MFLLHLWCGVVSMGEGPMLTCNSDKFYPKYLASFWISILLCYLEGSESCSRTCYLEVHISHVVFYTLQTQTDPLYTDIWYNDKTCYNDNSNGTDLEDEMDN